MMQIKTLCILSHFVKLKTNILRRKKKGSLLNCLANIIPILGWLLKLYLKCIKLKFTEQVKHFDKTNQKYDFLNASRKSCFSLL